MPMIQGIDGNALLAAFRQGRTDRAADDKLKLEREKTRAFNGLAGHLLRGNSSGGIAGQYPSPAPAPAPTSFGEAFSPQAMSAIESGASPAALTPAAPAPRQSAPSAVPDADIIRQMVALDSEHAGQIVTALKNLDEMTLKRQQTRNDMLGAAALHLKAYPPARRPEMLQIIAPQLIAGGWTPEELAKADLSDDGLAGYQGVAIDYDRLIDNALEERKFQSGKAVAVAPGGNVAIVKPDGSAQWAIGGGGTAPKSSGAPSGIPQGAQDYLRQHPELRGQFDEKYGAGASESILGGGASNGAGGFPAVR